MKSQVVVPVPMSIAASMITAVATTTTVDADMIIAAMSAMKTAVAANYFKNFCIDFVRPLQIARMVWGHHFFGRQSN